MNYYKNNTNHWLYIGWENSYPKSFVFMGGALCAKRPWIPSYPDDPKMESPQENNIIQYVIDLNKKRYYPDEFSIEQKKKIKWKIDGGVYPCISSSWKAGPIILTCHHFARKIDSKNAIIIFSKITIKNTTKKNIDFNFLINSNKNTHVPLKKDPDTNKKNEMIYHLKLKKLENINLQFASNVDRFLRRETLKSFGNFDGNLVLLKKHYTDELKRIARPVKLPNNNLISLYKNLQITLWSSFVKETNGDIELRGSGGNPHTFYQYDRTFSHDVPDMVNQFIKDGDFERARSIIESSYFQRLGLELEQNYIDAIPKYIVSYAYYLQFTGDRDFFNKKTINRIKSVARKISFYRTRKSKKKNPPIYQTGIMRKSGTLDNVGDYLLVDNFAAIHGLLAYKYLSSEFSLQKEVQWAEAQIQDINTCLNKALDNSMARRKLNYYMCAFQDKTTFWKRGYDGNWLGTSLMMSTFPWNASLKGELPSGTWKKYFDRSLQACESLRKRSPYNIPENSWGAWWGHEYGSCYNAGISTQTLYSEKFRTKIIDYIEFLLDNQSAPNQWGESFDQSIDRDSWTIPAADLETWGLSFTKQAILEMCISVKLDGQIILGRGIPDKWIYNGAVIAWNSVPINNNRRLSFKISITNKYISIETSKRRSPETIILNIAYLKNKITHAQSDKGELKINKVRGVVTIPPETNKALIYYKKS